MKQIAFVFILLLSFMVGATTVSAVPIDLGTFTVDPLGGVSVTGPGNGDTVHFVEQLGLSYISFYNDTFDVPGNATYLSFDYYFNEGPGNDDYLELVIAKADLTDANHILLLDSTGSGTFFKYYFTPAQQGQKISITFGLGSNEPLTNPFDPALATSEATISNLDLAVSVPEPGNWLLLVSGLVGLFGLRRKKVANNI